MYFFATQKVYAFNSDVVGNLYDGGFFDFCSDVRHESQIFHEATSLTTKQKTPSSGYGA